MELYKEHINSFNIQRGIVTCSLICLVIWLLTKFQRSNHISTFVGKPLPGPIGLPLVGYLPFLGKSLCLTITKLKKQYGDIFVVPVGMEKFVFLNSYDVIKEAMVNQADCFSGRYSFDLMERSNRGCGIIFKDGAVWQEHRRFALRVMKDFGLGRSQSEDIILHEAEDLRERLMKESGRPQYTKTMFCSSASNVISALEFGDRSGNDPEYEEFLGRLDRMISNGGFMTLVPVIYPFVNYLKWLFAIVEYFMKVWEDMEWVHDFARRTKNIEKHRKLLLKNMSPIPEHGHNYCDVLINEQLRRDALKQDHSFTEWQLIRNIIELFLAGTDTTGVTMCWAWVFLSFHPDVQRKVHEEIDQIIGRDRLPRMTDKRSCHYINAVLDEIIRMSSILPFALPHRTLENTTVKGFHIPKNSLIMPNLYAVLHDPELWNDPYEFRPNRFINPEEGTYRSSEFLIAFGMGKRACLGETLARMELFLFFTVLMQSLSVRLHEPHPSKEELLHGEDGAVRHLRKHQIVFESRDN